MTRYIFGEFNEEAADASERNFAQLIRAIEQDDHALFDKALATGVDVNAKSGMPLLVAAAKMNYLFLNRLVTAGADIPYAVRKVEILRSQIPYKRGQMNQRIFNNSEDKSRWNALNTIADDLNNYKNTYVKEISVINNTILQREIGDELRQLRALFEEQGPRTIQKQAPGLGV